MSTEENIVRRDHVKQAFGAAAERRTLDQLTRAPLDAPDWLEDHWVREASA